MLKERYAEWTRKFMDSWKKLDWKETVSLLANDVKYYENPIDKPCTNFNDLVKLWSSISENLKDIEYDFKIIIFDETTCIINWKMDRVMTKINEKQRIDGIFQISLNEDNLCTYFKQWRYTRVID